MGSGETSIFTKMIAGEIPAEKIYEDDQCIAIKDIHPQAPFHALVIPKTPIRSLAEVQPSHQNLLGHLLTICNRVAKDATLTHYRVVINTGSEAGQSVFHIHMHVLGGRKMTWPPG